MFNFRFFKSEPNTWVMQYRNGKLKRQGAGLSFFYFVPSTTLVAVPAVSQEAPFMLKETTVDYQEITVQGQLVYRVNDPQQLAGMMNFALRADGGGYSSEDPEKLGNRILNLVQVAVRAEIQQMSLREALSAAKPLVSTVQRQLTNSEVLANLGVTVVDFAVQAIRPAPETARALEASTREKLLQEADDAIYIRRNASIEQERSVKENELKTELAVEARKREIRESQIEAERAVKEKERRIRQEEMEGSVKLEERRQQLVDLSAGNERKQGEARAYSVERMVEAFGRLDPALVEAVASSGMDPNRIIAQAFKGLAASSGKIGNLNISPDLLESLLERGQP